MTLATSAPDITTAPSPGGLQASWRQLRAQWLTRAPRERQLLTLAGAVLGGFMLWSLAIAPAWRTVSTAPARLDALETQLQTMQLQAAEATALRATPPLPADQAQAALTAATSRLGSPTSKLSVQGDRVLLSLKGVGSPALMAWLAEVRVGARARVVEATLLQTGPGLYDGSLTLTLGGTR